MPEIIPTGSIPQPAPAPQPKQTGVINKIFFRNKVTKPPVDVPAKFATDLADPEKQKQLVNRLLTRGTAFEKGALQQAISQALATSYWRRAMYREYEQASSHAYVSSALDVYVDNVVSVSRITNRSCWITSEDKKLENTANQLLDELAMEERVRDWAGQLGLYGDFIIEQIGREGIGVAFVDDAIHPADMERIDINGRLEGFVRTGLYHNQQTYTADVEAPWRYIHFRTFGVSKKTLNTALGIFGEPSRLYTLEQEQFKDKKFRNTTKYGVSLLMPVVPIYKRLKMAEDSLLMSRITRGIQWYLYRIKVSGGNIDSAAELVQSYSEYLKRSTGLNTGTGQENWQDRFAPLYAQIEDLFVPESDDISLSVDPLGGEPNIKAIVDIELLVNQLLGSLRVSKAMLGITDDLPGAIGEGAAIRISINFAKNAQRLQAGLKGGIKRLCQIHLALRGMNPDPRLFDVNFAEISSAEEEELKNAMDKGVDVVDKLSDLIIKHAGEDNVEKLDLLDYLNQKFLRLDDLDLSHMVKDGSVSERLKEAIKKKFEKARSVFPMIESECLAYLPTGTICRINEESKAIEQVGAPWMPFQVTFQQAEQKA